MDLLKKGSTPFDNIGIHSPSRSFNIDSMENVSILFADIKNFTILSSKITTQELVEILNNLFNRFDKLCAQNGCEKISTLGDSYYCISNCPDHAKCCVEMGLEMIEAIKKFNEDTDRKGQDILEMRVGIHTGTVLYGIIGMKCPRVDIWSNDVVLANQLESAGMPNKVHVSDKTIKLLSSTEQYHIENGNPVQGIKTYFIETRTSEFKSSSNQLKPQPHNLQPNLLLTSSTRTAHKMSRIQNRTGLFAHQVIPKYVVNELKTEGTYLEYHKVVGIIFARIVDYNKLYKPGIVDKLCLHKLNELICTFDNLLEKQEYSDVKKIKTFDYSYMAASGLNQSEVRQQSKDEYMHLYQLLDFAMAIIEITKTFDLNIRVGFNYGDVIAGNIDINNPQYDIWGDAVNIASRMESTGINNEIQFPTDCLDVIQRKYNYDFLKEKNIKGKGKMNCYKLKEKIIQKN